MLNKKQERNWMDLDVYTQIFSYEIRAKMHHTNNYFNLK